MSLGVSVSSHLTSQLLMWSNPPKNKEGMLFGSNYRRSPGKIVATEIGLFILTTTSIVETIAYAAILTIASLILHPVTDKPYKFFANLLESSSFTAIWTTAIMFLNPILNSMVVQESFARYLIEGSNPTPISLFRLKDRSYVANWEKQHKRQDVLARLDQKLYDKLYSDEFSSNKKDCYIKEERLLIKKINELATKKSILNDKKSRLIIKKNESMEKIIKLNDSIFILIGSRLINLIDLEKSKKIACQESIDTLINKRDSSIDEINPLTTEREKASKIYEIFCVCANDISNLKKQVAAIQEELSVTEKQIPIIEQQISSNKELLSLNYKRFLYIG